MNTIKSVWYGWGTLIVAGGGAYYFAKRSINKDRDARHEEEMKHRRKIYAMEQNHSINAPGSTPASGTGKKPTKASTTSEGRVLTASLEDGSRPGQAQSQAQERHRPGDFAGSPSQEASDDPAATRHAPETEGQRVKEKSKYEASEPYRATKGDRFS